MKYKVFNFWEVKRHNWWFGTEFVYKDRNDLLNDVSKFIEEIGEKFFWMSHSEISKANCVPRDGQVIVWYR